MKIRDFILSLVSWFILLVTVSCSDELGGERAPISSESNLHVLVPTVLSSRGTRTDDASGLPTYNATVDECQINDLTLYAFPVPTGNGNDGKLLVETLPAPLATMMAEPNVANYQLNIEPGTYHIYVVANMNKVLSGQTIKTEDELKDIVLDYRPTSTTGMPVCTNIPMIYEPEKDAAGNLAVTEITAAGDKYTEVAANLKFTCVKVKLNLIFDPSNADVAFGGKTFSINSISAEKLSPFTHLYWGGKFETPTWEDNAYNKIYKDGIKSTPYEASSGAAVYYTDWTDNSSQPATNNKDDIKGTGTAETVSPAGKWLFQQTYYLPERYISSESDRSYLTINGKVGNSAVNNYRINLGHKKDETSTTEVPVFPRGTFYEITGAIKTLGNMELDCKVSIKPWETVPIDADFNHTTLLVSKAEASVTSTTNDFINYESNATITPENIGCETKIDGKDLIIPELNMLTKQIKLRINKDINYSSYSGVYTGTAKVWIKAGNIKKYIDVKYDVKPYFDVTPQEITIYSGSDNMTKVISFNTNLGGLEFTDGGTTYSYSASEAISSISYKNGSGETITSSITANSVTGTDQGTFSIKADQAVETSITHTIYVQPRGYTTGKYGAEYDFKKPIKITVKPAVGNYYIYLRVINDRTPYNNTDGSKAENNYNGTLDEGGTNNWNDGWYDSLWSPDANTFTKPQEANHCLYAYTQIGETNGKSDKVWKFTQNWPGDKMNADYANPGWYYWTFDVNKVSISHDAGVDGDIKMKPGETLLMFNNHFNEGIGYAAHRCPHHNEPGIPLFDYEDHEGWIVFDPTTDAMWHAFDEKPEIENIKITIYTQSEIYGWFIKYGIAANGQFKMFDTEGKTYTKSTVGSWHKTVITLKAIKGEHEKSIRLYTSSDKKTGQSIILFNGRSFKNDTGYYEGGTWYQGIPDGAK